MKLSFVAYSSLLRNDLQLARGSCFLCVCCALASNCEPGLRLSTLLHAAI